MRSWLLQPQIRVGIPAVIRAVISRPGSNKPLANAGQSGYLEREGGQSASTP